MSSSQRKSVVHLNSCDSTLVLCFQLRTAMVKGETGSISLSIRASVDKGVRTNSYGHLDVSSFKDVWRYCFLFSSETTSVPGQQLLLHKHWWNTFQVSPPLVSAWGSGHEEEEGLEQNLNSEDPEGNISDLSLKWCMMGGFFWSLKCMQTQKQLNFNCPKYTLIVFDLFFPPGPIKENKTRFLLLLYLPGSATRWQHAPPPPPHLLPVSLQLRHGADERSREPDVCGERVCGRR